MKSLIAALLIVSAPVFAQELDATDALLNILPAGTYSGVVTVDGTSECLFSVKELSDRVVVKAQALGETKSREILKGSPYRNVGARFFLSTSITRDGNVKRENIFRTIAHTASTQYIVVADLFVDGNSRTVDETAIECIIDL